MEEEKRLVKSRRDRVIGGVLGGLSEYFNLDSTLVRLIFIFIALISVKGALLLYIVLYLVIPDEKQTSSGSSKLHNSRSALGITLILLGFLLFFNELYHFLTFKLIWPIFLIVIGFYILIKGLKEENNENR